MAHRLSEQQQKAGMVWECWFRVAMKDDAIESITRTRCQIFPSN